MQSFLLPLPFLEDPEYHGSTRRILGLDPGNNCIDADPHCLSESTSNNRVKSGYENRKNAPIDQVPQAGAREGTSYGMETTGEGVASADIESGDRPRTPSITLSPPAMLSPGARGASTESLLRPPQHS
jgi:hypothetical protein